MKRLRKIIVIKKDEKLEEAADTRSFSVARSALEDMLKPKGFVLDDRYHPVRLKGKAVILEEKPKAIGFDYAFLNKPKKESLYVVRADFDDEKSVEKVKEESKVVGIYSDPKIATFPPTYCSEPAVGDSKTVGRKLGIYSLKRKKITGRGVRVAIVDGGINGSKIPVDGGWSPPGIEYKPGSIRKSRSHGTMCAFDVRISAPGAKILDYGLLQSTGETWTAFLSDAVAAFADLINLLEREPAPLVVNNSWGMFDRSDDEPIGSSGNYSANPNHPFNQITGALVSAGADVLFAAGNCGIECPDDRCGSKDIGPGKSIHGSNSHPDVITVAAVTTNNRRLGYSAQGPGGLYQRKPDLAAFSHFEGSGEYPADGGTSAACPVAAGVAAALREKFSNSVLTPAMLKGALQRSAIDINGNGWDYDMGYGLINPKGSLALL